MWRLAAIVGRLDWRWLCTLRVVHVRVIVCLWLGGRGACAADQLPTIGFSANLCDSDLVPLSYYGGKTEACLIACACDCGGSVSVHIFGAVWAL